MRKGEDQMHQLIKNGDGGVKRRRRLDRENISRIYILEMIEKLI